MSVDDPHVSDAELFDAGIVLGLSAPREAYLRRHPPVPTAEDERWFRQLEGKPPLEPLSELEQERLIFTLANDSQFRAAVRAALEA